MDSVRTAIIGRPRHLPSDRRTHQRYTLICDEPRLLSGSPCLDGNQIVNCQLAHTGQVIASATGCDWRGLMTFLGGREGQDVLLTGVSVSRVRIDDVTPCVFQPPKGTDLVGSAEDILSRGAGDVIRKCSDSLLDREVACSDPHTLEVVFSTPSSGADIDCSRKFEEYLGRSPSAFSGDLKLFARKTSQHFECAVELRGAGVLTGSIRRLGDRKLPLAARTEAVS